MPRMLVGDTSSFVIVLRGCLSSHGWKKRIKVTVANLEELERSPEDDEVKDHVKQNGGRSKSI